VRRKDIFSYISSYKNGNDTRRRRRKEVKEELVEDVEGSGRGLT
jgi:hypothetical protein